MRAIYGGGTYNQVNNNQIITTPSTTHAYLPSSSKLVSTIPSTTKIVSTTSTSTTYTLPPSTTHTSTNTSIASLFTLPVIIAIIAGIAIIILAVVIL